MRGAQDGLLFYILPKKKILMIFKILIMVKNYFTLIAFSFFISGINNVIAQTKAINITTTAVPFLRISADARGGGMGDVGIAISPDANSAFWNIAKIPFAQSKAGIGFTYTPWLRGLGVSNVYLASMAGYYKLDETQAISTSIKYFSLGDIQFNDEMGNDLNSYRPREFSFDAGYSRKLSGNLALGIALRYIHSNLANGTYNGESYKAASAVAGDISLFHDGTSGMTSSGLNWGVTITNLGSKISYTNSADKKEFLPARLGIGLAYTKVFDENTILTFGADVNHLLVPSPPVLSGSSTASDSAAIAEYRNRGVLSAAGKSFNNGPGQFSVGAEAMLQKILSLRAGYFYETRKQGDRRYATVGAGLTFEKFSGNFSYLIPTGTYASTSPLQNTLRVGFTININNQ
jgi:hypothetical protein